MMKKLLFILFFALVAIPAHSQTVLDDFNRSSRLLTTDGWGQIEGSCSIINNTMGGTTPNAENLCYTPNSYNADMAAFITISTKCAVNEGLSFFVRFNSSTNSGYDIQFTSQSGDDRFRLFRFDNGTFGPQLGSTYYTEVSAGAKFGIVANGTSLKCYYLPAGSKQWVLMIDVTDSTYTAGGRIAFGAYGDSGRYDDLIGGNDLGLPNTIIFEDSFNNHNDWSVPYQWNAVVWPDAQVSDFPSANPTTGARMIGYAGQDSVITGQTNPRIAITPSAGRGVSGKGMRMRCEAIYGQDDQHSVWYSDTQTYYTLTETPGDYGYTEIWIQMWRRYQPNFYSRAGNIKYMHVSHFRGGSLNDWHYDSEADVDHAPLAVLDTVTFDSDINCCTGVTAYDDLTQDFEPWAYTMFRLDPYDQRTSYNPTALYEGIFHHTYLGEVHATLNITGEWRDPGNYGDGGWHYHEVHLKMNSAPGVADGEYGYYIDGVPQLVLIDVPWIATGGTMVGWNMVSPGGNQDFHTLVPGGETFYYDIDDLVISANRVGQNYTIDGSTPTYSDPTITAGPDVNTTTSTAAITGSYSKDDALTAIITWSHGVYDGICVGVLGEFTGTVTDLQVGQTTVTVTIEDSNNGSYFDTLLATRSDPPSNQFIFTGSMSGACYR